MKNIFHGIGAAIAAAVFPEKCVFCGKFPGDKNFDHGICPDCSGNIYYFEKPDISEFASQIEGAPGKIYCACHYTGVIKKAIISFKYGYMACYAESLSWVLYRGVSGSVDFSKYDFICAVPASELKLRERGYNQAELLARGLSSMCGVPYRKNILVKTRDLPSQSLLNMEERLKSVRGIYQANCSAFSPEEDGISGKRIVIVDDVLTTGATIIECARMLWSKGARDVAAVILATGKRNI